MSFYCLGFAFASGNRKVLLVRKSHPDWQKGSFNAPGGSVQPHEKCSEAMVREFKEETGFDTKEADWALKIVCVSPETPTTYELRVYHYVGPALPDKSPPAGRPDEPCAWLSVPMLDAYKTVGGVPWMIPMLLDKDIRGYTQVVVDR